MLNIQDILKDKKIEVKNSARPKNENWELADEFAKYCHLTTPFVMRLFKIHGREKVLSLKSWLKDLETDHPIESLCWRLKQLTT